MILPPDDRHPVIRPRAAGKWAETLRRLGEYASAGAVITAGTPERVEHLRRQLPAGAVVLLEPAQGAVSVAVYAAGPLGPRQLPDALLPQLVAELAQLGPRALLPPPPKGHPLPTPSHTEPPPPDEPREGWHRCPCGCSRMVPNRLLACRAGWLSLPDEHRRRVGRAPANSAEHVRAVGAAVAWLRGAPGRDDD